MNTRNAFHGLDENLAALAPKVEAPKLSYGDTTPASKSLLEEDDYFKANLPPTYDMEPEALTGMEEEDKTVLGLMNENCSKGYENMVKDLSRGAPTVQDLQPEHNKVITPYRYQTITFENLGYSGANVDVRPYGIAKFHFVAEFDNELGLNEGDMVYLLRYVDNEWLEAEVDSDRR